MRSKKKDLKARQNLPKTATSLVAVSANCLEGRGINLMRVEM